MVVQLFITPRASVEATYELERRLESIAARAGLSETERQAWLLTGLNLLKKRVTVIPEAIFAALEGQARLRIPRDSDDWPTVALALALNSDVWTEDKDFFGCGLPVWRTDVLYVMLDQEQVP